MENENYTVEVAKTTIDPKILTNILRRGNEDEVSMYAAMNLNCPSNILEEVLGRGKNGYVSCSAAKNPNCPINVLEKILVEKLINPTTWSPVALSAATNSNCSKELLTKIFNRAEDNVDSVFLSRIVINPNFDQEIIIKKLKEGNDDFISGCMVNNPNCPLEEKIKWMQETNKIEKEDESKGHIIEYEKTNTEDDLSDLKKLIGKTFNLKKHAQNESWYNEEVAKTTKNPQILTDIIRKDYNDTVAWNAVKNPNCPQKMLVDILKKGNNDVISFYAAENPNCPKEMLVEILRREKNDWVSVCAASNPNCSKEIIIEIIRRGKDDLVSQYVVSNPNCPPEILEEVLKRGKSDTVSFFAAKNPNCPTEIFKEIIRRGKDDLVSEGIIKNPNCPKEILIEILNEGKNDWFSFESAHNHNCPDEAKIKWMYAVGRIKKEDESKGHIIEYEKTNQEDDLSDLKKLISKNSGWYKVAVADGEFRDLKNKVEKIKDDIRDFKKENKDFDNKLKKIEKIIEDLNIGNRQFWQTQNIFTSLQRKIEKFEVVTQEWQKFKKEIDKDIRSIIEKKMRAQVKL